MILWKEGATQAQEDEANAILEVLTLAYPGHPWGVRVYEGGFFIRHLDFPTNYGMNCKYKKNGYSASAMKKEIIFMAGEWLERAGLKRGAFVEGDSIKSVDGVPLKFQPAAYQAEQKDKALDKIVEIAIAEGAIRTEPMPQVREAEGG